MGSWLQPRGLHFTPPDEFRKYGTLRDQLPSPCGLVEESELTTRVVVVLAGLMGAFGVVLAALAAHGATGSGLQSAAFMLLFHAVAVLSSATLLDRGQLWPKMLMLALAAWILGAVLFSGDIAIRFLSGSRLFPMAAPIGGAALIAGWVLLAVSAIRIKGR